ncbi:MAG: divalent-cation tolerance protein CutA [Candidatus Woesearchaeota archaeon]
MNKPKKEVKKEYKKTPIIIYTTCKDKEEAEKISKHLLEKKLIACTNIFQINSFYFWDNELQNDSEYVILIKTFKSLYKKIEKEIKKIHSYKVPAIYSWELDNINKDYFEWMKKEIKT